MLASFPRIAPLIEGVNPSALHKEGVALKKVLQASQQKVAAVLHAHTDEIIFTSGATESDNLALLGAIYAAIEQGVDPSSITILTSDLEHSAVLEVASHARGINTITVPTANGVIDPKLIAVPPACKLLIVSIIYVSNELGTVQPIKDIAKRVRYLRKQHPEVTILLHTDATQAPLYFSLNTAQLGVDMLTLGAAKLYTPKGVGVLYKKRSVQLSPILYGGGQQAGLRPGTQPVALIHTFAHALEYAQNKREQASARITELRDYFEQQLQQHIPLAIVTALDVQRSPHISHIAIKNFDSELLVIELDAKGIAVSAKSACKNEEDQESHIVQKIYGSGWGAVRFSFGRMTKKSQIDTAVNALKKVLQKYNEL